MPHELEPGNFTLVVRASAVAGTEVSLMAMSRKRTRARGYASTNTAAARPTAADRTQRLT